MLKSPLSFYLPLPSKDHWYHRNLIAAELDQSNLSLRELLFLPSPKFTPPPRGTEGLQVEISIFHGGKKENSNDADPRGTSAPPKRFPSYTTPVFARAFTNVPQKCGVTGTFSSGWNPEGSARISNSYSRKTSCPWELTRRDRHNGSGPFFAGLDQGGNEHQKGKDALGHQVPVVNPEIDISIGNRNKGVPRFSR
jgi:hypothetical protein